MDPWKKGVNLTLLPKRIHEFVRALTPTLMKTHIVCIEEQKISVQRIKIIALLLFQTIQLMFPHITVQFVDPEKYRAFFNITVKKKDYPKLSQSELRLVRKGKSFHETKLIPPEYRTRVHHTLKIDGEFAVDPIEAGLMAVYCLAKHSLVLTGEATSLEPCDTPEFETFVVASVTRVPYLT